MKIDETQIDRYGRSVLVFSGVKKLSDIYEWLFSNYNGYKFGIVLDCSQPEREELDGKIYVNFLDELLEEIANEAGYNYYPQEKAYKAR